MTLKIYDTKKKQQNIIPIQYVKLLEVTRGNIRIIYKDSRTPDLTIKASQITFGD